MFHYVLPGNENVDVSTFPVYPGMETIPLDVSEQKSGLSMADNVECIGQPIVSTSSIVLESSKIEPIDEQTISNISSGVPEFNVIYNIQYDVQPIASTSSIALASNITDRIVDDVQPIASTSSTALASNITDRIVDDGQPVASSSSDALVSNTVDQITTDGQPIAGVSSDVLESNTVDQIATDGQPTAGVSSDALGFNTVDQITTDGQLIAGTSSDALASEQLTFQAGYFDDFDLDQFMFPMDSANSNMAPIGDMEDEIPLIQQYIADNPIDFGFDSDMLG